MEVKLSKLLSSTSEEGAAPVVVSIRDRVPSLQPPAAVNKLELRIWLKTVRIMLKAGSTRQTNNSRDSITLITYMSYALNNLKIIINYFGSSARTKELL